MHRGPALRREAGPEERAFLFLAGRLRSRGPGADQARVTSEYGVGRAAKLDPESGRLLPLCWRGNWLMRDGVRASRCGASIDAEVPRAPSGVRGDIRTLSRATPSRYNSQKSSPEVFNGIDCNLLFVNI